MIQLFQTLSKGARSTTQSVFDTNFINSIVYAHESGYQIRSAASEWHFSYTGTYLGIKVKPTAYNNYPNWAEIVIVINGVVHSVEHFTNESIKEITLPAGFKTIQLIEGLISKPNTIIGTFITDVILDATKFTKINETGVPEKIVFIGDSITVGANSAIPSTGGFAHLFKYEEAKQIGILGYGYGRLKDFAQTQAKINTTTSHINEMFSNVLTSKKLVIALGTNDFALDATNNELFGEWYSNLLDAIHIADASIQIFCISPLLRKVDGVLLDEYRAVIGTACETRDFCTHIPGKSILLQTDLADGVHPSTAGHAKMKGVLAGYLL